MNMTLNMKNGRVKNVSKLKTLIQDLICVKNNVYPASIKNDNGSVAMKKYIYSANGANNSIN